MKRKTRRNKKKRVKRKNRKSKRKKGGSSCISCLTHEDNFDNICDNLESLYFLFITNKIDYDRFMFSYHNIISNYCEKACTKDINLLNQLETKDSFERRCTQRNNRDNNN